MRNQILMIGTHVKTMGGIASVVRNYYEYGIMERLGITYSPTHRDGAKSTKIVFYLSQIPVILWKLPRHKVLHIHTSQGWSFRRLVVFFLMARLLGKRSVWHVHGSSFDSYFAKAGRIENTLIRHAFEKSDAVIALSDQWKQTLLAIAPKANIIVIRNAVNVSKYSIDRKHMHEPACVLFLGRLGKRKGIYDLLESIDEIRDVGARYVLAGDGDIAEVKAIIKRKNLSGFVEIPGWVGPREVVQLLHEADIYVLPSYDEGLPMGILEAMASGLPVVSTPIGGIPEAVINDVNGYLVKPGDTEQLSGSLRCILQNDSLWSSMSQSSASRAHDQFGMTEVETRLFRLYTQLM